MVNTKIPTAYFREQTKFYTFDSFKKELGINDNSLVEEIIQRLRYRKLIKPTTQEKFNNAKIDEDFEDEINIGKIASGSSNGFTFDFVGVAYTKNCILKCYPKYIDDECTQIEFDKKYQSQFKTVIKTIKKYNQEKQQRVQFYNGEIKSENFNRLSVMLYILNDYIENGVYTNQKTIIETNGEGEIDWDKTINETFALIKNNQPYYFDLQTINTVNNDEDFIKLVHECIVSDCSRELVDTGILDMFDMQGEIITSMTLNDLGDKEFIKYKLENELKNQFITKKQNLLKTLYTYVTESQNGFDASEFSFYGVHKFAPVWEKACADIFENHLNTTFKELKNHKLIQDKKIINPNYETYWNDPSIQYLSDSKQLKSLIEQITWTIDKDVIKAPETLIPDIVTIMANSFFILDAKYYCITVKDKQISQQPGIQDIIKQFAYHRAFIGFIEDFKFLSVQNAFLIPQKSSNTSNLDFNVIGKAELKIMQYFTKDPLAPIQIVELKPTFVFNNYLNGKNCTSELTKLVHPSQSIELDPNQGLKEVANNFELTN